MWQHWVAAGVSVVNVLISSLPHSELFSIRTTYQVQFFKPFFFPFWQVQVHMEQFTNVVVNLIYPYFIFSFVCLPQVQP